MTTSVPVWQHVLVVLVMLGLHMWSARLSMKRIRDLEYALVARDVLLGKERPLSEAEEMFLT
jgi:hypothetical protein